MGNYKVLASTYLNYKKMENTLYIKKSMQENLPDKDKKFFARDNEGNMFVGSISKDEKEINVFDNRTGTKGSKQFSDVEYWLKPL
jgi:lipopolysaccharide export LptBFGC system permease protein LptF